MSKHWKLFLDNFQHYFCTSKKGLLIAWITTDNQCHFHRWRLYPDTEKNFWAVDEAEVVPKYGKKECCTKLNFH